MLPATWIHHSLIFLSLKLHATLLHIAFEFIWYIPVLNRFILHTVKQAHVWFLLNSEHQHTILYLFSGSWTANIAYTSMTVHVCRPYVYILCIHYSFYLIWLNYDFRDYCEAICQRWTWSTFQDASNIAVIRQLKKMLNAHKSPPGCYAQLISLFLR